MFIVPKIRFFIVSTIFGCAYRKQIICFSLGLRVNLKYGIPVKATI